MTPTKNGVASVSGFTPCPDVLIDEFGHTTALVWGKIWRFSQMSGGVCRASILRLADELGLTDDTIAKHVRLLEGAKYIKDTTPTLRNKPHIYKDTHKLSLKISVSMDDGQSTTEKIGSHYRKNRLEESTTRGLEVPKNVFQAYEEEIGPLTPAIADTLKDAEELYDPQWIIESFSLAAQNSTPTDNKRNWRYCEKILKRWKKEGKDDGKGGKPAPTLDEALKKAGYK